MMCLVLVSAASAQQWPGGVQNKSSLPGPSKMKLLINGEWFIQKFEPNAGTLSAGSVTGTPMERWMADTSAPNGWVRLGTATHAWGALTFAGTYWDLGVWVTSGVDNYYGNPTWYASDYKPAANPNGGGGN
jgi:hypothetical protein